MALDYKIEKNYHSAVFDLEQSESKFYLLTRNSRNNQRTDSSWKSTEAKVVKQRKHFPID